VASSRTPRVKICGLTRPGDAALSADAGADLVGCVLVGSSPRAVSTERAGEIRAAARLPLVVVVAGIGEDDVARAAERAGASVVQLHGDEDAAFLEGIRARGPWKIWKALRVKDPAELPRMSAPFSGLVDGLLLDGWDPDRLGGTGVPFDWSAVARVRSSLGSHTELIAAGGLRPENVNRAIELLHPDVVDVSSGVEARPGVKDPDLVRAFISNARRGIPTD
jgi:phosphoribosylanthranilate isomerase